MAEIAIKRQPIPVQPTLHDLKPRRGEKSGGQGGTLIMAAVGALFLSYVFNFRGFQDSADGYFHGLDVSARSQTPAVAHLYLTILPYAGMALALGIVWILMRTLLGMVSGAVKPKKKKADRPHAEQPIPPMSAARISGAVNKATPHLVAEAKPTPKPPAVCVKPLRLDMRDVGVAKVILPRR